MHEKESWLIKGMDTETAQKYMKMKVEIDEYINQINGLGILLSLLSDLSTYEGCRELIAIEYCGKLISDRAHQIMDLLDCSFIIEVE